MTDSRLAAVVMAAGLGTRMRSKMPKHLHPLLGRRMVDWVIAAAEPLEPDPLVVVTSATASGEFEGHTVCVQEEPLGTGDAIRAARAALEGKAQDVLVLAGDAVLLTPGLLEALVETHRSSGAPATLLSIEYDDRRPYGRIVRDAQGGLERIVEARDASPEELEIREMNSSIYVFRSDSLWPLLDRLEPHNVQGELYLTDTIGMLVGAGEHVAVHLAAESFEAGVNNRAELAAASAVLRRRLNEAHMLAGATIVDPETVWIESSVQLAPDVVVHPFTVLRGDTRVAEGAEIGPHAVVVDASIGARATVGPFCYVRPGTVLEDEAKAGTFVEIKNSRIGARAKVPHLSYVGDADVGDDTNIAAGNITANFSHRTGVPKGRTSIGRNVRTGVDNTFKAPVTVGDDAWIFPGTVITDDVPAGSLAGFPARQITKEGWVYEHDGDD